MGQIEGDGMADHAMIACIGRRYTLQILIWYPPKVEALDKIGRSTKAYRPHEIAFAASARSKPLFLLATNVVAEHFEPILPMEGTTHVPSRFTRCDAQRLHQDGYCAVLNVPFESAAATRQVIQSYLTMTIASVLILGRSTR